MLNQVGGSGCGKFAALIFELLADVVQVTVESKEGGKKAIDIMSVVMGTSVPSADAGSCGHNRRESTEGAEQEACNFQPGHDVHMRGCGLRDWRRRERAEWTVEVDAFQCLVHGSIAMVRQGRLPRYVRGRATG
jgi:hypothetical protein